MMSNDGRGLILASLFALPLMVAAGSASAFDAPAAGPLNGDIDHTPRIRVEVTQGSSGAVDAIASLKPPVINPQRASQAALAVPAVGGLRRFSVDWRDALPLAAADDGAARASSGSRPKDRPSPYVRLSEHEQVFGFSFKIQPPPPVPDLPSPRS